MVGNPAQPKPKADILARFDPVKIPTQHKINFNDVQGQEIYLNYHQSANVQHTTDVVYRLL